MIIGIGCDMVDHTMTKKLNWASDKEILLRFLSEAEFHLYQTNRDVKFLAGRFAAKEAVLKCLGTGMYDGISLTDIQILQEENGQPVVNLLGNVKELAEEKCITSWHISISHSSDRSTVFVIAESQN